ncbi:hypothetical protein P692DRAFT_20648054, partial [Suillus brevipes Sb2]
MGKHDHIPELLGTENYIGWATKMQYTLACEDYWCHVNTKAVPGDLLGLPLYMPAPKIKSAPMDAEVATMREWLLKDMKAKELITRRLCASVASLVPRSHNVTARKAWQILQEHFNRTDMSAQYLLHQQVQALRMKDSADTTNYVTLHAVFRERLVDAGAPWGETDAIYHMLMGLPQTPIWQQFKALLEQRMHDESMHASSSSPHAFTFESCISRITSEAARHVVTQLAHASRPGSEYANAAATGTSSSGTNSITGLRIHKFNPQGIFCTTPGCNKGDHDHAHCYQKGGGMEGQAPWMKPKKKDTPKETTTVAAAAAPAPTPPAPAPVIAAAAADITSLMQDLSFASISELPEEIACAVNLPFTTILDSGTTVTLVKDRQFFHSYSTEDTVDVLTVNHGVLQTTGRGNCVAWLTIGQRHLRIRLSNCLHAPGALLNLLSVSCMNAKGWDVNFRSDMTCALAYKGTPLGHIPATRKLYAPDLEFIPFEPVATVTKVPELTAFVDVPLSLDLWH